MGLCVIVNIKHQLSGASEASNFSASLKLAYSVKHLFPDMSCFHYLMFQWIIIIQVTLWIRICQPLNEMLVMYIFGLYQ